MMRAPTIVACLAGLLAASPRTARAGPPPEEIFAELRRLQAEGRHAECSARGREAAPGLVDLEVVWLIVGECEASEGRWCDASASVARFLAAGGASEARMTAARQLEAEARRRCDEARAVVVSPPPAEPAAGLEASTPEGSTSAAPWLIGAGGVAVVTGVVLLLVADATADDMATLPQGPDYLDRYADLERDHRTQLVAGHVSTWTGLALVGTGVLLVVLDDDPRSAGAVLSPSLTRGGLVMSLVAGF